MIIIIMKAPIQRTLAPVRQGTTRKARNCGLWLAVLPLLASSFAQAQPTLDVKLWAGSSSWDWTPTMISSGTDTYKINDVTYNPSGVSLRLYDVTLGMDPHISASVDVLNN